MPSVRSVRPLSPADLVLCINLRASVFMRVYTFVYVCLCVCNIPQLNSTSPSAYLPAAKAFIASSNAEVWECLRKSTRHLHLSPGDSRIQIYKSQPSSRYVRIYASMWGRPVCGFDPRLRIRQAMRLSPAVTDCRGVLREVLRSRRSSPKPRRSRHGSDPGLIVPRGQAPSVRPGESGRCELRRKTTPDQEMTSGVFPVEDAPSTGVYRKRRTPMYLLQD